MKVTLKLYALLSDYLPPGAQRNEISLEVPDGATVTDVLTAQGVPLEACHLVLINGAFVPPRERDSRRLQPGDVLAAWPPVAGG